MGTQDDVSDGDVEISNAGTNVGVDTGGFTVNVPTLIELVILALHTEFIRFMKIPRSQQHGGRDLGHKQTVRL